MSLITDIAFFALLFFLLVFVHELGHFLMAKWMGIKVEKFSIGMGPSVLKFQKGETEYRLGILPLGGYVKMAGDDPSKEYTGEEKRRGFLTQKPPAKLLVVFGGPVFNLLLPIFIFGFMMAIGIPSIAPTVGTVVSGMPAEKFGLLSGDRVISYNGTKVTKWTELEKAIQTSPNQPMKLEIERVNPKTLSTEIIVKNVTPELGDGKSKFGEDIKIGKLGISPEFVVPTVFFEDSESILAKAGFKPMDRIRSLNGAPMISYEEFARVIDVLAPGKVIAEVERDKKPLQISFEIPQSSRKNESVSKRIGMESALLVVGSAEENNPASRAGIQSGDRLISIGGKNLKRWEDVSTIIRPSEGKPLEVVWSRAGKVLKATMTPEKTTLNDPIMGKDNPNVREAAFRIGVSPLATMEVEHTFEQSWSPLAWLKRGLTQTWDMTSMTMEAMGKLVTGQLSLKLLGSPIMIYKVAGNSYRIAGGGQFGWISFFSTLALLSISLGIINLFPIPVLDGGHATFFLIEWIRGRPLSLRVMEIAMQVGLFLIVSLFALVIYNDFYRYGWLDPIVNLFK